MYENNSLQTVSGAKIRELVTVGLLSAIVFLATMSLHVPIGTGGVIHLGDSMVFVAAILFGRKEAALSGAIGMTLFDILSPYAIWAPYTFVIKGVMGFIAGSVAYAGARRGNSFIFNIAAIVLSGIWMIAGYYIAEFMIYGNIMAPIASIPANLLQAVGGAAIALPLAAALKRTRYLGNK